MNTTIAELAVILFGLLLAAIIIALIFRQDFRDAVLGGNGEATVFGLITVRGVAVVLLCALFVGGLLATLTHLAQQSGLSAQLERLTAEHQTLSKEKTRLEAETQRLLELNGSLEDDNKRLRGQLVKPKTPSKSLRRDPCQLPVAERTPEENDLCQSKTR